MKKIKVILSVFYWLIFLFLVGLAAILSLSRFNNPLKLRFFSVQSGSMAPTIPVGSLIVVRSTNDYQINDIVSVRGGRNDQEVVTHRIVDIISGERPKYQLKGDANENPDPELVPARRVIGKLIITLPYLGYLIAFAQTPQGFIILLVVPGVILLYSEINRLKEALFEFLSLRKQKRKDGKKG